MTSDHEGTTGEGGTDGAVGIGWFACSFGELERRPQDIPGFAGLWAEQSPGTDFSAMGCGTFRTMTGPVLPHVVDAVGRTLKEAGLPPEAVDHLVIATSDGRLASLPADFAAQVLDEAGLSGCVPLLLSYRQCCGSLAALSYGHGLFADPSVHNVLLVSLDLTPDDRDRVRSFALFSDAAVSCLLTRRAGSRQGAAAGSGALFRLLSCAVRVDHEGLYGRDSFLSRQRAARGALDAVLGSAGRELDEVAAVFPTNLYAPVAVFNASITGLPRDRLHFTDTLAAYGHCGNSDWMINALDHRDRAGIVPGEVYLAQSSAPGFHACALLAGVPGGAPVVGGGQ